MCVCVYVYVHVYICMCVNTYKNYTPNQIYIEFSHANPVYSRIVNIIFMEIITAFEFEYVLGLLTAAHISPLIFVDAFRNYLF